MSINDNITSLRKNFGYSQDDVANKLGVSRQTFSKVENGSAELSYSQLKQVADFFGIQVTDLFYEPTNLDKFKSMIIYILSKFKDHGLPKTKLAKLLYLSDFSYYYTNLESMSNISYKCKEYGPLAEPFLEMVDDMHLEGELHIDTLEEGAQMLTLSKSVNPKEYDFLSKEEKSLIDKICDKWKDASSQELVNFTHKQKPWMACRNNEVIPYDLILQEDPDNVF